MHGPHLSELMNSNQSDINQLSSESYTVLESNSSFNNMEEILKHVSNKVVVRDQNENNKPIYEPVHSRSGKTKCLRTQENNCYRGRNHYKQFLKETRTTEPFGTEQKGIQFCLFMKSLKPNYTEKSWKANVLYALEVIPALFSLDFEKAKAIIYSNNETNVTFKEDAITKLLQEKIKANSVHLEEFGSVANPIATSISKQQFNSFINYLRGLTDYKSATLLVNWLFSGLLTGLRQKEWLSTELIRIIDPTNPNKVYIWLYVANEKASKGSENREARCMDVTDFSAPLLKIIQFMVDQGKFWRETVTYKKDCRLTGKLLKDANGIIKLANGCTLSHKTLRFQFLNNVLEILSLAEGALLMGHKSPRDTKQFYLKPNTGWKFKDIIAIPKPVPIKEAIARINEIKKQNEVTKP